MGFLGKLFSRAPALTKPTKGEVIHALVQSYGAAMEAHAESGSIVSDVSKLPAPKDAMRAALIALIWHTEDKTARELLKGAYVMLSEFQPNVGRAIIKLEPGSDPSTDTRRAAAQIADQCDIFIEWSTRVAEEASRLNKDLIDAKL